MSFIYTPATTSAGYTGYIKTDLTKYDANVTLPSAIGTFAAFSTVALTSSTELVLMWGTNGAYAVVWDELNKVFGSASQISTASLTGTSDVAALGISANSVLVCNIQNDLTTLESVVLSITGTTITVNTVVSTTLANRSAMCVSQNNQSNGGGRLFKVGSSYVLCYYASRVTASYAPTFIAMTISGTTPTLGAELSTVTSQQPNLYTNYLVSASVIVQVSSNVGTLYATPISVSGTTLTLGTGATLVSQYANQVSAQLSNNRIAIGYQNSGIFGAIVSVSGTTATMTSVDLGMATAISIGLRMQTIGNQAFVSVTTTPFQINVLTDNAGTAVAGTALTNPFSAQWDMVGCDSSKVWMYTTSSSYQIFSTYSISGNNPSLNSIFAPDTKIVANVMSSVGGYNRYFGNFENSGQLRTSTYKTAPISYSTYLFGLSFDGASYPLTQMGVSFLSSVTNEKTSSLSTAAGWQANNYASALNTIINFRRVELA